MKLQLKKPMIFFDIETTGVNPVSDRIVELCATKQQIDHSCETKTWRVNPTIPIPARVSELHGIRDEDVKDAPVFGQIANEVFAFFEGCDLAGYNLRQLDIPVLVEEFLRVEIEFKFENRAIIDVFKIFQFLEPRTLSAAYKFYCDKELKNAHSADADVEATHQVLESQLDRYTDKLKNDVNFLHDFTKEADFVDTGKRLVREDGVVKFNFGKHKGKPVEVVFKTEPQYYDWIMKNNFLQDTKRKLTALKLQSKFGNK